jgi:hypothetical protein
MMRYLIGIDDTDNLETRGTGHHVRQLADWLAENSFATPKGITRHQLLVDPRIPYTSHNSSACLAVDADRIDDIWKASRDFLIMTCADGSDAGLCMVTWEGVNDETMSLGWRAKSEVLTMLDAWETASKSGIRCEGLTGTHCGIIGALAAIGLHRSGDDGRFLWLPGLRQLNGRYSVEDVIVMGSIERVCTLDGEELSSEQTVDVGEWVRPILRDGKSTLYVEEQDHEWHILSKEHIKNLSN